MKRECGTSIWEFNLRDILRWCQVLKDHQVVCSLWCYGTPSKLIIEVIHLVTFLDS